jgi:hypothetical protein
VGSCWWESPPSKFELMSHQVWTLIYQDRRQRVGGLLIISYHTYLRVWFQYICSNVWCFATLSHCLWERLAKLRKMQRHVLYSERGLINLYQDHSCNRFVVGLLTGLYVHWLNMLLCRPTSHVFCPPNKMRHSFIRVIAVHIYCMHKVWHQWWTRNESYSDWWLHGSFLWGQIPSWKQLCMYIVKLSWTWWQYILWFTYISYLNQNVKTPCYQIWTQSWNDQWKSWERLGQDAF